MKLEDLYGEVVDVIVTTSKIKMLARGLMEEHPCGDGSILLFGEDDYDVQLTFFEKDVVKIDMHVGHYQKATLYIEG